MKLDVLKNTKRNMVFGFSQKIISTILPFILRTVIIYALGIQYAGINSLFTSILSVLSLAELGVGNAIVFSMYKPIAEEDSNTICCLLAFYKKAYRIIGIVILSLGLLIIPVVPFLVRIECPNDINAYYVYILTLLSVVASYLTCAYKTALFVAFQRNDITSIITTVILIVQYLIQIILILVIHNYYVYPITVLVMAFVNNFVVSVASNKIYPQYQPSGELSGSIKSEIITKVKSVFLYKIGAVVTNSVDTIVISAFLGVTVLGIYGNYYYVITALFGFLEIYYSSMRSGLGNKFVLESKESNYELFNNLFFAQGWIIGWMTTCLVCLYQDFISLWAGSNLLLDFKMVVLLGVYFYTWKINDIAHTYKDAAGIWEYDRYRPLISALCNLCINIVLVKFIGLYGVVISTIVCELAFGLFWGVRVLYSKYFITPFYKYLIKLMKYTSINLVVIFITYFVTSYICFDNVWWNLLVKLPICCILPNILLLVFTYNDKDKVWLYEKVLGVLRRGSVKNENTI